MAGRRGRAVGRPVTVTRADNPLAWFDAGGHLSDQLWDAGEALRLI